MRKKLVLMITFLILMALAVVATSFFFLIKGKQILLNPYFVSRTQDIIGVDISHYQGTIDLGALASQNIKFVYFKATEGSSYVDEHFEENWEKSQSDAAGRSMLFGAYHFFSFETSGDAQARNYISAVSDLKGRLTPVVDVELYGDYLKSAPDKSHVVKELKIMLSNLEAKYLTKPMIYAEIDFYNQFLSEGFDEYPFWIRSIFYPIDWGFHKDWTIWQYTDRGELDGYTEERYIDLNKLNPNKKLNDLVVL